MRCAIFLRGINVGGVRVPMPELRALLEGLGLTDVRTFLSTGNATATSSEAPAELRPRLEEALGERFGYDAHAQVMPAARLQEIVDGYPFPAREGHHRYAILCEDDAVRDELADAGDADVAPGDGVVYWSCPRGSTTGLPFSRVLARRRFRAGTTTRNLSTLEKMLAAAG